MLFFCRSFLVISFFLNLLSHLDAVLLTQRANPYNVCIVGGGLGGLVTASRLATSGKSVLILEKNSACGGRLNSETFSRADCSDPMMKYRFDVGPSLLLLPDVYAETFKMIGEELSDWVDIVKVDPFYRCYFQDGSFADISSDENTMKATINKLEPGSWNNFKAYMEIATSFLRFGLPNVIEEKLDLSGIGDFILACLRAFPLFPHSIMLQNIFRTEKLRALMSFQDLYIGLSPYEAPSVFSLLQALELERGIYYPKGGFGRISSALESIALAKGVDIVNQATVVALTASQGKPNKVASVVVKSSAHSDRLNSSSATPTEITEADAAEMMPSKKSLAMKLVSSTSVDDTEKKKKQGGERNERRGDRDDSTQLISVDADVFCINLDAPAAELSLVATLAMVANATVNGTVEDAVVAADKTAASAIPDDNNQSQSQSQSQPQSLIDERTASGRPSCGIVSLHFALSRQIPGLAHHTLFLSSNYKESWAVVEQPDVTTTSPNGAKRGSERGGVGGVGDANNASSYFNPEAFNFYVHAPSRTDDSACPLGHDAITVLVPVRPLPKSAESSSSSSSTGDDNNSDRASIYDLETIRSAVLQRMQAAIAACDVDGSYGAIEDHVVGEHIRTPLEWREEFGLFRGSAFGLAHSLDQLSALRPRIRHPHISNLYRVGASTRPGNGVPLVMIGARLSSDAILDDFKERSRKGHGS